MNCTIWKACVLPLFFGTAQAAVPPVEPIPASTTPITLEIRLKGAPTATNPLPTLRTFTWNTTDALNYNYTAPCWNTSSNCPAVYAVTIRVMRKVFGLNLNITQESGLCNANECLMPSFTPIQAKPGESYFFDYSREKAQWNSAPKIVSASAPPPPPPPSGASPDGTRLPPATVIVDSNGDKWTLAPDNGVLKNGVLHAGGYATEIVWKSGRIYVHGVNGPWYFWDGTAWTGTVAP